MSARFALVLATSLVAATPAAAAPDAEQQIRTAITRWTEDFNARRADRICDLFAPDLRYDYRGFMERGYKDICALLKRSLDDPARRFRYALDIKEVLVAGDLAVVRLVWILNTSREGAGTTTTEEPGMDVFRRQPDGSWKIIRYIAYEQ